MNYEELEKQLSDNFDGEVELMNMAGEVEIMSYDGSEDDLLEFDGAKSLKDLSKTTARATFTIKNDTASQVSIALLSGTYKTDRAALVVDDSGTLKYKTIGGGLIPASAGAEVNDIVMSYNEIAELVAAGQSVDAVMDDGIVYALASDVTKKITVTASSAKARVRNFKNYIDKNPSLVTAMHISSTDAAYYENEITYQRVSPFKVYDEERIPLQDYFTPSNQLKDKIIIKNREFKIDGETLVKTVIPAGAQVTFTFVIGVQINSGTALTKKVAAAKKGFVKKTVIKKK